MSETSGFFNAELVDGEPDRAYEATDFASYYSNFVSNGVFANPASQLQVVANTDTQNSVKVNPGNAYINGYWYKLTEEFTINFPSYSLNEIRWYPIILRLNLTSRNISLIFDDYTVANSSRPIPNLIRTENTYDLLLAQVKVFSGNRYISNSEIYDTRSNEDYCGIVAGLVKQINTSSLFQQYDDQFNNWFNEQKGLLENIPVGNITAQLSALSNSFGICEIFNDQYLGGDAVVDKLLSFERTVLNFNYRGYSYPYFYTLNPINLDESMGYSGAGGENNQGVFNYSSIFDTTFSDGSERILINSSGTFRINIGIFGSLRANVDSDSVVLPAVRFQAYQKLDKVITTYQESFYPILPWAYNLYPNDELNNRTELNNSREFVIHIPGDYIGTNKYCQIDFGFLVPDSHIEFVWLPKVDISVQVIRADIGLPDSSGNTPLTTGVYLGDILNGTVTTATGGE